MLSTKYPNNAKTHTGRYMKFVSYNAFLYFCAATVSDESINSLSPLWISFLLSQRLECL